ncbi:MAG: SMC-Scp complex subunit ScpB [Anaerolineaceae bacterium]|jgi:segregation and condensation protein B
MSDEIKLSSTDHTNLGRLEALLFAASGLSSVDQLAQALEISHQEVERLANLLGKHYEKMHGLRLQRMRNQYQLVTAAEHASLIEKFLGLEVTSRLSQQALEVLAIVAYKQPTTRPEIDGIRGVNSDTVLKSLLAKGLIEELGRSEAPGRPILYGVTQDFLLHFGLESLDQLPAVDLDGSKSRQQTANGTEQRILKD